MLAQGPSFSVRTGVKTGCSNTFPQRVRNKCTDGRRAAASGPPLVSTCRSLPATRHRCCTFNSAGKFFDAVMVYPWEDKVVRAEIMTHGSVVTEEGGLLVIRGPPPSYLRIPLRLASCVLTLHINATFKSTVVLPTDVMAGDLLFLPRPLFVPPPTPPPPPPLPLPPPAPPAPLLSLSPTSGSASANRYPINLDGAEPSMTPKKLW